MTEIDQPGHGYGISTLMMLMKDGCHRWSDHNDSRMHPRERDGKEGGSRKEGRKDDGMWWYVVVCGGMTVTERIGCDQAEGCDCLTLS